MTNADGELDYDFVRVKVYDPKSPEVAPPRLHLAYYPTSDIEPGTEITFKGRAFYLTHGEEVWDFGDGTPQVKTKSDGNVNQLAKDGYVTVKHQYQDPGDYLVHVHRIDEDGRVAEDRLHIRVSEPRIGIWVRSVLFTERPVYICTPFTTGIGSGICSGDHG